MSLARKFILVLTFTFFYIPSSNNIFAAVTTPPTPSVAETVPAATTVAGLYTDSAEGFSMQFPTDWQTRSQYLGTAVMGLSPQVDANDNFPENINVVSEKLPTPATSQQYYDANLVSMKQMLKEFSIVQSNPMTVAGNPAIVLVAQHIMGELHAKVFAVFMTRNNKGYVITCTAKPDTFDQYKPVFDKIIASFKFL